METREQYSIDQAVAEWFQVELIDSKGRSHGFIGYRFNAAGAEAACNGWNNNRDRGDLVAVIKPFEAAKPADAKDSEPRTFRFFPFTKEQFASICSGELTKVMRDMRDGYTLQHIVPGTRIVSSEDPTAKLRGHNKMLTRALDACLRAMDNGSPLDNYVGRWNRARVLASDVLKEVTG